MTVAPTKSHFALIGSIRGLAALLVVYAHTMPKEGWFFTYVFDPGKIGVVVFFFISGYLVIPSAARDGSAAKFLSKRFFRLYPLYWVSLMMAYLVWPRELSTADWLANVTMAQQLFGFKNAIDVYWTLTIEVVLYTVITAFLLIKPDFLRHRFTLTLSTLGLICLFAASLRWHFEVKIPVAVPLGLFCMFTGAHMRLRHDAGQSLLPSVFGFLAIVIPTCWLAYSFAIAFNETASRYIISYVTGGIVFLMVLQKPNLDLGALTRLLGEWSFGIYLFHMIFSVTLMDAFGKGWTLLVVTLFASVVISAPLYYIIERPSINLGRRFLQSR